jgi:type II secretory pathway pseudopilin PulG
VISIVSLLGSVVLAALSSAREKSRINAGRQFASQLDHIAGDQAIGMYALNDGSGTSAFDTSGNGASGVVQNGPTWSSDTPSGSGYALLLDGINDYIEIAEKPELKYLGGDMTLSAWIKPDVSDTDGGYIMSKPWNGNGSYNYRIAYNADGTIYVNLGGSTSFAITTTAKVPVSKWSLVTIVLDASKNIKVYIDGIIKLSSVHTIASWIPSVDSNLALCIGTLYPYGPGAWSHTDYSIKGLIDDPRVFAKSLVASEVQKIYAEGIKKHLASN